jgi:pimeloyl-ACP methyl ester carboxylesterase
MSTYHKIIVTVMTVLILTAGCGNAKPVTTPAPTPTEKATYVPVFEPGRCRFSIVSDAECGDLIVPEDRAQPDGSTVRLHVAIFKSTNPNPQPDPVIYLMGGAGGNALGATEFYLERVGNEIRKSRDFIMYNQRGTHYNEPFLECPGEASFMRELKAQDISREEADEQTEAFLLGCRDHLLAQGVDLAMYNSVANAADANDLRIALGYEKVNYYGTSYGTRLGLTIMRYHPESVRSVILDSVFPPQVDYPSEVIVSFMGAVHEMFESCSADEYCSGKYPHLEETFYQLIDDLHANPVETFAGGKPVVVDDTLFLDAIYMALHPASALSDIPFDINAASLGNFGPLGWAIESLASYNENVATGVHYSSFCKDEIDFDSHENAVAVAADYAPWIADYYASPFEFRVCEAWPTGAADPVENESVVSDIPALIFAGRYDPITSPNWCQRAAETLSNSYYYEFPNMGHGVMRADECALSIGLQFLGDPTTNPDSSCMDELSGLEFK